LASGMLSVAACAGGRVGMSGRPSWKNKDPRERRGERRRRDRVAVAKRSRRWAADIVSRTISASAEYANKYSRGRGNGAGRWRMVALVNVIRRLLGAGCLRRLPRGKTK
jgi:hypothetical protein